MTPRPPVLRVPIVDASRSVLDELLDRAPGHELADATGRGGPVPATRVSLVATREALVALFVASSEPPLAVAHRGRGGRVFEDECVELFLERPSEPGRYLEVVVNPAAALYAAEVDNPDGSRASWRVSPVLPRGLEVRVSGAPAGEPSAYSSWRCRLEVPWSEAGGAPSAGEVRRANAFRIARGLATHHLALSPTLRRDPPDFHVPSLFARLRFTEVL
ncbi:MAG: hypothetical protein EDX89_14990 [Acidobacteria bacterium]|nr:MAG: hypothetical protein EDX89_14990 [Acidobacteriota bacterium]